MLVSSLTGVNNSDVHIRGSSRFPISNYSRVSVIFLNRHVLSAQPGVNTREANLTRAWCSGGRNRNE